MITEAVTTKTERNIDVIYLRYTFAIRYFWICITIQCNLRKIDCAVVYDFGRSKVIVSIFR